LCATDISVERENLMDLTRDLKEVALLAGAAGGVDDLLARALDRLADVVPYDLAAVLELDGDELRVRAARGRLADHRVRAHRIALADAAPVREALASGRPRVLEGDDHAHVGDVYDGVLDLPHGHSCMVVPLQVGEHALGAMTFDREQCVTYDDTVVNVAAIYGHIIALAMTAAHQAQLLDAYRHRLEERHRLLEQDVAPHSDYDRSRNEQVLYMARMARQVAPTDVPVLITGETGVGKEVLARAVHGWSARKAGPFIKINCAALPDNLVESELFGHTRGAFSGATDDRPGRFAVANGGSLLLDEIGDLPLPVQAKLLRVLQEGTFEPVGSDRTVKVDVRILAATHVDLQRAIETGRFREDLYYRLNVFPVRVPALRERLEDVPLIAGEFLAELTRRTGRGPWTLTQQAIDALRGHDWPGNVRELINVLERATILVPSGDLVVDLAGAPVAPVPKVPAAIGPAASEPNIAAFEPRALVEVEKEHIRRVLDLTGGKLYGEGGAAELLGMKPSTLQSRMSKHGIKRG